MKQADYVIIGAGPAAVAAAETLRSSDKNGSIAIISRENISPYSRMALPYFSDRPDLAKRDLSAQIERSLQRAQYYPLSWCGYRD